MKKLRHVPTGIEGEFVMTLDIEGVENTRIDHSFAGDKYAWTKPSSEFVTVIDDLYPHRDTSVPINYSEPSGKPFYKSAIFWTALISIIAILFLANSNRNLRNQIEATETNKRLTETQNRIDSVEQAKTAVTSKIITNSEDNAMRANNLVKSIKNEKPIITDTTHAAMYEYVRNYRPE